ncbi:hypothetical protein [Rhodoferax sediminis]|jgi:hypothetical protein|uniref:Uncharacterized protein n=1 Tax=Rhodoferax sediminis TaxID=2509614 RepID=A0A515D8Z2_9BURK|nr:hypothetical protein [Rhodoferax sediminis]QDL36882.1 hypothetical protein EUB48_05940 [Rhodoferax sediminis]
MYFISMVDREFHQYGARAYLFQSLADAWLDPRPKSRNGVVSGARACAIIEASRVMISAD